MATFTPPTEEYAQTHPQARWSVNRLMRYYGTMPRGRNVYYLSDGTVTENDPDSRSVFWTREAGSPYVHTVWWGAPETPYTVTSAQATALTDAGYTVT